MPKSARAKRPQEKNAGNGISAAAAASTAELTSRPQVAGQGESAVFSSARVPPPASAPLRKVAEGLVKDADRLSDKILQMISNLPDYRLVKDEALWTEISQVLKVSVPLFFSAALEGRPASDGEISTAQYFARRRVHQGITLRGQLMAYRNGMWILWEELVGAVGDNSDHHRELLLRAAWVFRHLDVISGAITEAYVEEQEGKARDRHRLVRHLIDEILDGGSSTAEELTAQAAELGIDVLHPLRVVVASPPLAGPGAETPVMPSLASPFAVAISEAAGCPIDRVVTVERDRSIVALAPDGIDLTDDDEIEKKVAGAVGPVREAGQEVVVGMSDAVEGIEGLRRGYKEAARAVEIGALVEPEKVVHFYHDLVLHDLLEMGGRAGLRLIEAALGPLLADKSAGERYIETLHAFFAAGSNLKVAAAALEIHPNTLAYRMRQIHKITGTDFADPEVRLRAEVALRLLAIERQRAGDASG